MHLYICIQSTKQNLERDGLTELSKTTVQKQKSVVFELSTRNIFLIPIPIQYPQILMETHFEMLIGIHQINRQSKQINNKLIFDYNTKTICKLSKITNSVVQLYQNALENGFD